MNKAISYTDALMTQQSNIIFHKVLQAENCAWQIDSESKLTIIVPSGKLVPGSCALIPVESNSNEKKFVLMQTSEVIKNIENNENNENNEKFRHKKTIC